MTSMHIYIYIYSFVAYKEGSLPLISIQLVIALTCGHEHICLLNPNIYYLNVLSTC